MHIARALFLVQQKAHLPRLDICFFIFQRTKKWLPKEMNFLNYHFFE